MNDTWLWFDCGCKILYCEYNTIRGVKEFIPHVTRLCKKHQQEMENKI